MTKQTVQTESQSQFDVRDLIRLSLVPGIGTRKLQLLIKRFKNPAYVFEAHPQELIRTEGISRKLALQIKAYRDQKEFVNDQLKRLNKCGAHIITLWDNNYPQLLKQIYDPPPYLFVLGAFKSSDENSIALVGTRRPSDYGKNVAEQFSQQFAHNGITTVSGLARGIDTYVHTSTLNGGGRTIAVLGSGVDIPYPRENKRLLERISENGAVVSEFPMGAGPDMVHFPRRNRIISGLSIATIIIESGEDGGALITASMALDQNRDIFAIPGSIYIKTCAGTNQLIRDGKAKLVSTPEQVLEELQLRLHPKNVEDHRTPPPVELSLFESKILEQIQNEPIHIDAIAERANVSTVDALVSLLSMEFKGIIRQLPGKHFIRM
jgi:DNA processing protein